MEKITKPIYLIGMPGSGKSEVAKTLSQKLNTTCIDLDKEIEKHAHMFVHDIFDNYGEEAFRLKETEALKETVSTNAVISCGGGIVLNNKHKSLMKEGIVIYLMVDVDMIESRIEGSSHRPLLKKKSLKQLFDERMFKYLDFADVTISNEGPIEKTVEDILEFLKRRQ